MVIIIGRRRPPVFSRMIHSISFDDLLKKYDVPVPRYTSYPTVPCWDTENFNERRWIESVIHCFRETNESKGISIYVHLPFCESLCTYCACNTRITRNHGVEGKYLHSVLKEWRLYKKLLPGVPVIRELHLGGGTPTFFSPSNLNQLIAGILESSIVHPEAEFSFEGHPNNTTEAHLQSLFDLGFRRVSYGVQDLDEKVQRAVNRIQPFENLENVTGLSREIGFNSVSFDLIYGLPWQTVNSVQETISKVITLNPDRIAFYSYAHVPWMRPGQRGYEDADLPGDTIKRTLYETGRQLFTEAGYLDIGMDHFALPGDSLAEAHKKGSLHRNFMGYTTATADLLIGLGASSISDSTYAFAQNLKKIEDYEQTVASGRLPIFKGHMQTDRDRLVRQCILNIACKGYLPQEKLHPVLRDESMALFCTMEKEGIIKLSPEGLKVTQRGQPFIRNICSVLDERMSLMHKRGENLFSKAI